MFRVWVARQGRGIYPSNGIALRLCRSLFWLLTLLFPVKPSYFHSSRAPSLPSPQLTPLAQLHEATIFFSQAWAGTVHLSVLAEDLVLVFWKWFTVPASNQWG